MLKKKKYSENGNELQSCFVAITKRNIFKHFLKISI